MKNKKPNTDSSIDNGKCCGASKPEDMAFLWTNVFSSPAEALCVICEKKFSNFNCYCEVKHDCSLSEEQLAFRARSEEIAYLNNLFALESKNENE